MQKFFMLLTFMVTLVFSTFSQNVGNSKDLPKGVRRATAAEAVSILEQVRSGQFSPSTEAKGGGQNNTPYFAIRVTGDNVVGITATARSTRLIPRGSIVLAERVSPNGNVDYLYPLLIDNDIPANWLWYDMENSRKGTWNEMSGLLEYRMTVLRNGQMFVSSAVADFMTYNGSSIRHTIVDGLSAYDGETAHFYLFGNFGGAVGVASLKSVQSGFEIDVPTNAVNLQNGRVDIDFSMIPDAYLQPGDYIVTIADRYGYSDSFTLRHSPFESSAAKANAKRLQAMSEEQKE